MTLDEIRDVIAETDPNLDPESGPYKTQVILLASAIIGPNIKKLAKFTGYPRSEIASRSVNWREAGIWVGGHVCADNWFDEETGMIGFIMQAMVGDGILECEMK